MKNEFYNLDYLMKSFDNNKEDVLDIVNMFIELVPSSVEEMKDVFEKGDAETVNRTAHKLKTTFMLFESNRALALAKELEMATDLDQMNDLINQLDEVVQGMTVSLKKDIKVLKDN